MTYHIVLADDQPLVRECVKRILAEDPDFEVVAEADDGVNLLNLLKEGFVAADLIIVDISMPRMEGIEAIRRIKALYPHIKTLVLSMHKDKEYVAKALAVGATGYLVKENADAELVPAVGKIRQGGTYISSCFEGEINNHSQRPMSGAA